MKSFAKPWLGFTLIEVLVALIIFTLITILGFRALTYILDYVERDESYYQDQDRIQRAWNILLQDMLHLRPRAVRDRLGGITRAYQTGTDDYLLVLTRGGMPTITGTESGLQRVAYSLSDEGEFLRWTWPGMDLFNDAEPASQLLIGGVARVEFWQLNASNEFEQNWPPLNQQVTLTELPRMVRLVIEMEDGAQIERLIPGVESPSNAGGQQNPNPQPGGPQNGNTQNRVDGTLGQATQGSSP